MDQTPTPDRPAPGQGPGDSFPPSPEVNEPDVEDPDSWAEPDDMEEGHSPRTVSRRTRLTSPSRPGRCPMTRTDMTATAAPMTDRPKTTRRKGWYSTAGRETLTV